VKSIFDVLDARRKTSRFGRGMKVADTETMKNNKTKSPKCFLPKRKKSVAPKNPLTTPPAFGVIQESKKKTP